MNGDGLEEWCSNFKSPGGIQIVVSSGSWRDDGCTSRLLRVAAHALLDFSRAMQVCHRRHLCSLVDEGTIEGPTDFVTFEELAWPLLLTIDLSRVPSTAGSRS